MIRFVSITLMVCALLSLSSCANTPKETTPSTPPISTQAKTAPAATQKSLPAITVKPALKPALKPAVKPTATPQAIKKITPTKMAAITPIPKPVRPKVTKKIQRPTPKKATVASAPKQTPAPTSAPVTTPTTTPEITDNNKTPTTPHPVSVSLEKLPINIGQWTLTQSTNTTSQCSLISAKKTMQDGQGDTRIYLELAQQHTTLHTKSNIDTSYSGTGLFFGKESSIALETLYTPTSIRFNKQHTDIVNKMQTHPTVEIRLGFWPTWPVTRAYSIAFDTTKFERAYAALLKCNSLF